MCAPGELASEEVSMRRIWVAVVAIAALGACGEESTAPGGASIAAKVKATPDSTICGVQFGALWGVSLTEAFVNATPAQVTVLSFDHWEGADNPQHIATYNAPAAVRLPKGAWKTSGDSVADLHANIPVVVTVYDRNSGNIAQVKNAHIIIDLRMTFFTEAGLVVHVLAGTIAGVDGRITSALEEGGGTNGQFTFCKPT
jgi:hypothetical protein